MPHESESVRPRGTYLSGIFGTLVDWTTSPESADEHARLETCAASNQSTLRDLLHPLDECPLLSTTAIMHMHHLATNGYVLYGRP